MKTLVVLVCVVAAVSTSAPAVLDSLSDLIPEEWRTFKLQHKKSYTSDVEDAFRMRIFAENKLFIAQHNQLFLQGRVSYKVKLNMFADMLYDEFLRTMYGFNTTNIDNNSTSEDSLSVGSCARSKRATYPSQIDWRDKGAVTAVKNQGSCGSCWAFSATGAFEGQNFIKNKKLVPLSEQNLIDCSSAYGNKGCKGGFMTNAFNYVKDNGGINSESSYPYQGSDQTCRYKSENSAAKGTGFVNLARGDEEKLMQAVATVGPISVAIDAGQKGFQFYADGVYYDKNCSSTSVNHGLQHKKSYTSDVEDAFRMRIFAENKLFIAQHNQLFLQGRVSYKVKLNMFADMLYDEFLRTMYGFNTTNIDNNSTSEDSLSVGSCARSKRATYPSQIDWRDKGAVTAVKNQGSCGSCWAFSATGAFEGQNFIKNKKLVPLSEQNLIDCSSAYGNKGCKGGFMTNAFNYVKDNGGINSESSYPYQGSDQTCRYKSENSAAKGTGFVNLARGDEEKLMQAVATVGPISVAIDAGQKGFQFYADGVYYDKNCSSTSVNHGVLVVGYGSDYWLVKNSWGTSWGQSGYIKMARNKSNHCAIANWGCYPLV